MEIYRTKEGAFFAVNLKNVTMVQYFSAAERKPLPDNAKNNPKQELLDELLPSDELILYFNCCNEDGQMVQQMIPDVGVKVYEEIISRIEAMGG
jgi:hypothetical protein